MFCNCVRLCRGSYIFFKITVNKRFYDYFTINMAELLSNYKLPTNSNINTKSNKHRLYFLISPMLMINANKMIVVKRKSSSA